MRFDVHFPCLDFQQAVTGIAVQPCGVPKRDIGC